MTKLFYHGGVYTGQVTPEKHKRGRRARRRLVPHGFGTLSYKNDVFYSGYWRFGYEHGRGVITWATGEEYSGCFPDKEKNEFWKIMRLVGKTPYTEG